MISAWRLLLLTTGLVCCTTSGGFGQTILTPWGNVVGMRVSGETLDFEAGLRVMKSGKTGFSGAVKYLQRPKYTLQGDERRVVSQIAGVEFELRLKDTGLGEATLDLSARASEKSETGDVYFWFDLPDAEFGDGTIQVSGGNRPAQVRLEVPGDETDVLSSSGTRFRVTGRGGSLEVDLGSAHDLQVRRNATDRPTPLNDPKVEQNFLNLQLATSHQVYIKVMGQGSKPGLETQRRFLLKGTAAADPEPVRLTLKADQPGRPFAGIGGNFRLQFPEHDPAVIQYHLDNLRLCWGRVEMPWADWDPAEDTPPLAQARSGKISPRVQRALEMARQLSQRGIPVMISAWEPPRWARLEGSYGNGLRGTGLDPAKLSRIRASLADYLVFAKEAYQVEPALFSFNEPDVGVDVRQTPEEHAEYLRWLGTEFSERGLKTKLLAGDTAHGTPAALNFLGPTLADPVLRKFIGGLAIHTWRGCTAAVLPQWSAAADRFGVPLLVTEGGPDAHLHEYPSVRLEPWFQLQEADLYVRLCGLGQPGTILPWQLTADYSLLTGGGMYGEDGQLRPTQRFWNVKQLSETPPNAAWLPVACNKKDVTSAAFLDKESGCPTIHIVNNGGPRKLLVSGIPAAARAFRVFVTDAVRGMECLGTVAARSGTVELDLPPAAFVTLRP